VKHFFLRPFPWTTSKAAENQQGTFEIDEIPQPMMFGCWRSPRSDARNHLESNIATDDTGNLSPPYAEQMRMANPEFLRIESGYCSLPGWDLNHIDMSCKKLSGNLSAGHIHGLLPRHTHTHTHMIQKACVANQI